MVTAEYPQQHKELLYNYLTSQALLDSGYILRTVEMIKTKYPGSVAEMLPRLRTIYKAKRQAEKVIGK